MLHEFGTCANKNTNFDKKNHADLKTCQTSYIICYKNSFFKLYFNPGRWDRTSKYIALRCQVFAKIDNLIEYKKHNYYIHATLVYDYNSASPISHQCKHVIVYWSDYPDVVILITVADLATSC